MSNRPPTQTASPAAAISAAPPAVEFRGVSKRFGNTLANDALSFCVPPGSIHGLIGENGAGKSTAMKILYGLLRPDGGEILVDGVSRNFRSPTDAIAIGLGMVHQHFLLAGPFTALDNILVGAEPMRRGFLDRKGAQKSIEKLACEFGLDLDVRARIDELPVGMQQRIELLKLLYRHARILILDEPTAVLTPNEVRTLFQNLTRLKEQGKTILLVTHKLKEVLAYTDRVTVLRGGRVSGEFETRKTSVTELAASMIGRELELESIRSPARARSEPAVECRNLTFYAEASGARPRLDGVSFTLARGEILGIAGVEGNGQTELASVLLDPRRLSRRGGRGEIRVLGHDIAGWSAAAVRALGVAVIPEDRQKDALLPRRPLFENFLLGLQDDPGFCKAGFIRWEAVRRGATKAMASFDVQPLQPGLPAGALSGGNQQKLVLAREFYHPPDLIMASHPARGLDVGAIQAVHRRLIAARDRGAGVLLISSDLEEVTALADRIIVLFEGRIAGEFQRGRVSEQELGLRMGGG